jgi:hypothetical protein
MSEYRECFICHRNSHAKLERHHIFNGANRPLSEKYGLCVYLCRDCHTGTHGVHNNAELMRWLKRKGQRMAMERYGWSKEQFKDIFGKNYL